MTLGPRPPSGRPRLDGDHAPGWPRGPVKHSGVRLPLCSGPFKDKLQANWEGNGLGLGQGAPDQVADGAMRRRDGPAAVIPVVAGDERHRRASHRVGGMRVLPDAHHHEDGEDGEEASQTEGSDASQ